MMKHKHPEYPTKATISVLKAEPCLEGQNNPSLVDISQVRVLGAADCIPFVC
jgi:hypothetical protein